MDLATVKCGLEGSLAEVLVREGWACLMMGGVESRQQEGLPAASTDSLPCFLWVPLPMVSDQLQTTFFSKNKHAYGIGGAL